MTQRQSTQGPMLTQMFSLFIGTEHCPMLFQIFQKNAVYQNNGKTFYFTA